VEIRDLEYLLGVGQCRNFAVRQITRAQHLDDQPRIGRLEDELGVGPFSSGGVSVSP